MLVHQFLIYLSSFFHLSSYKVSRLLLLSVLPLYAFVFVVLSYLPYLACVLILYSGFIQKRRGVLVRITYIFDYLRSGWSTGRKWLLGGRKEGGGGGSWAWFSHEDLLASTNCLWIARRRGRAGRRERRATHDHLAWFPLSWRCETQHTESLLRFTRQFLTHGSGISYFTLLSNVEGWSLRSLFYLAMKFRKDVRTRVTLLSYRIAGRAGRGGKGGRRRNEYNKLRTQSECVQVPP